MKAKLVTVKDVDGTDYTALVFWCPGCENEHGQGGAHMLPVNSPHKNPQWDFDGNLAAPTLSPSILSKIEWSKSTGGKDFICHSFLRGGVFQFLDDCTHKLKGQHVPLPDMPEWLEHER